MWETSGENLLNPQSDVVLSNVKFMEGEAKLFFINLSSIHHWLGGRRIVWCVVGIGHTVPGQCPGSTTSFGPQVDSRPSQGTFVGMEKTPCLGVLPDWHKRSNTITLVLNSTLLIIGYAREELCVHAPKRAPFAPRCLESLGEWGSFVFILHSNTCLVFTISRKKKPWNGILIPLPSTSSLLCRGKLVDHQLVDQADQVDHCHGRLAYCLGCCHGKLVGILNTLQLPRPSSSLFWRNNINLSLLSSFVIFLKIVSRHLLDRCQCWMEAILPPQHFLWVL